MPGAAAVSGAEGEEEKFTVPNPHPATCKKQQDWEVMEKREAPRQSWLQFGCSIEALGASTEPCRGAARGDLSGCSQSSQTPVLGTPLPALLCSLATSGVAKLWLERFRFRAQQDPNVWRLPHSTEFTPNTLRFPSPLDISLPCWCL